MKQWCEFFAEGGRILNQSFTIVRDDVQRQGMEEAGFVDIQVQDFKVSTQRYPLGEIFSPLYQVSLMLTNYM